MQIIRILLCMNNNEYDATIISNDLLHLSLYELEQLKNAQQDQLQHINTQIQSIQTHHQQIFMLHVSLALNLYQYHQYQQSVLLAQKQNIENNINIISENINKHPCNK